MEDLASVLAFARAKRLGRKTRDLALPQAAVQALDPLWRGLQLDGLPYELAACLLDCGLRFGAGRTMRWLARCLRAEALLAGQAAPMDRHGGLGSRNRELLDHWLARPGLGLRLAHGVLIRCADHARRHAVEHAGEASRTKALRRALAWDGAAPEHGPRRPAGRGGRAHA